MTDSPNDDNVLTCFRAWLNETRDAADSLPEDEEAPGRNDLPPVGLLEFVEEFTALKHELKLQTKSSRSLTEQSQATLGAMQQAIEVFRAVESKESAAAQQAARPLVEALLDLDEASQRGREVIVSARRRVLEESSRQLREQLDRVLKKQPWYLRWLCRRWHNATRRSYLRQTADVQQEIFHSLLEGYDLMFNRLRRTMKKHDVYQIPCLGKLADPNTMTVVELVDDPCQPPGLVVEQIRPGYYWKGIVFRFAEVRAVGGKTP